MVGIYHLYRIPMLRRGRSCPEQLLLRPGGVAEQRDLHPGLESVVRHLINQVFKEHPVMHRSRE